MRTEGSRWSRWRGRVCCALLGFIVSQVVYRWWPERLLEVTGWMLVGSVILGLGLVGLAILEEVGW
jgi:hypothetical protein